MVERSRFEENKASMTLSQQLTLYILRCMLVLDGLPMGRNQERMAPERAIRFVRRDCSNDPAARYRGRDREPITAGPILFHPENPLLHMGRTVRDRRRRSDRSEDGIPKPEVSSSLWRRTAEMKRVKLTPEEREIEESADKWVPASEETRARVDRIIERSKKNEAISLRMTSFDLSRIKAMATEQGMPYQTLINVVVHKYVTNQMYEKDEVLKTLKVAKEAGAI